MIRRLDLTDYVTELTAWHKHREPYEYDAEHGNGSSTHYKSDHVTDQPPLLTQLDQSITPAGQGGEVGAAAPGSRPTANLDAIAAACDIDLEAARWVRDLGEDDPQDTIGLILRLHGLTASVHRCSRGSGRAGLECCTFHAIEVSVRSWWVRARVLTGWDTKARKLDGTCPLCGVRGCVQVRLSSGLGACTNCHETWDQETIGILAEHMRAEAETERFLVPPEPMICQDLDDDDDVARIMLCPDCGSRRCVKAQEQIVTRLHNHRRGA